MTGSGTKQVWSSGCALPYTGLNLQALQLLSRALEKESVRTKRSCARKMRRDSTRRKRRTQDKVHVDVHDRCLLHFRTRCGVAVDKAILKEKLLSMTLKSGVSVARLREQSFPRILTPCHHCKLCCIYAKRRKPHLAQFRKVRKRSKKTVVSNFRV